MSGELKEGRIAEMKNGEIYLYMPLIYFLISKIIAFSIILQFEPENTDVWEGCYRVKTRLLLLC